MRKKPLFQTIFARQFVFYMSALMASFVILAVAMSSVFSDYFITEKANLLTSQAKRISGVYFSWFGTLTYDKAKLEREISVLHEYLDSSFLFVDADHTILTVTSDIAASSGGTLDLPEFAPVFAGEVVTNIGTVGGIFTNTVLTVAYPVKVGDEVVGAVFLCSSMPDLERSASEIYRITLFWLVVTGGVAFVLVFILSRTMTKPLSEMNEAAKVIASGDFEKRIDVKTIDELGQLAQTFNNMAESLCEQEQLRRIFIANVSHDLRSPLTSIRGFLQAILDGTVPPEKHNHYLAIVMDETERLSKLAHDIIDLNKIQSYQVTLDKTTFDMNALIRHTVRMFESRVVAKNIAVVLTFAEETTFVFADEEKIQRVVFNLLDNAVKFCGQDDSIVIETTLANKKLWVSVKDSGPGVSAEHQRHVFDRFFKVDTSRGEHKEGSGLGLSIVAAFIKAHGETITLTSTTGDGCEFVFGLPVAPVHAKS